MNAKQFLMIGGIILLVIGVIGFIPGIIGPTPSQSIFGDTWFFDNGQNWAHTILGIVALIASFTAPTMVQKWFVVLLGIVGIVVGVYSFFNPVLLGSMLQNPADSILYIVLGVWALMAGFMTKVSGRKVATI
jgi:uncharacterized membrane protein HdeD (DUF308 family)